MNCRQLVQALRLFLFEILDVMKRIISVLILFISISAFSQKYSYAVVTVTERVSKKFNVKVDLGDTPEQIKMGESLSEELHKIKSQAAVLNYMSSEGFELFESKDVSSSEGSNGIVLILRKEKE